MKWSTVKLREKCLCDQMTIHRKCQQWPISPAENIGVQYLGEQPGVKKTGSAGVSSDAYRKNETVLSEYILRDWIFWCSPVPGFRVRDQGNLRLQGLGSKRTRTYGPHIWICTWQPANRSLHPNLKTYHPNTPICKVQHKGITLPNENNIYKEQGEILRKLLISKWVNGCSGFIYVAVGTGDGA